VQAAAIAIATVVEECSRPGIDKVLFVCHSQHDAGVYEAALASKGLRAEAPPRQP
jgi:hypothetical protein